MASVRIFRQLMALLCLGILATPCRVFAVQTGPQSDAPRLRKPYALRVPPRTVVTLPLTIKGQTHTLTLRDAPLPEDARFAGRSELSLGRTFHYRALTLTDRIGKQREEHVVMLAYWHDEFYSDTDLSAALLPTADGHLYLTTVYARSTMFYIWVYEINLNRNLGSPPLTFDPVSRDRWPLPSRPITGVHSDLSEYNMKKVRMEYNAPCLTFYGSTKKDGEFVTSKYWRLDMETRKWTEIYHDEEKDLPGDQLLEMMLPVEKPLPESPRWQEDLERPPVHP